MTSSLKLEANPDPNRPHDVAVLGAGAAGICAAIRAAELGASVVLLEKNRRPGVKILMSGGTRCNITNARGLRHLGGVSGPIDPAYDPREARGARSIQAAFGPGGPFLATALKALTVEQTIALFESEGVSTKIEANGKVFPATDRAVDVLDALLRRLDRSGARLVTRSPVSRVSASAEGFQLVADGISWLARRLIVATGGQSYPGCGTTGDGFAIARQFGHALIEPRPALVPIRVAPQWVKDLGGVTLPDATAAVVDSQGSVLEERREAVLFAHFGLTGPAILDVSRAVARRPQGSEVELRLDLVPGRSADALETDLITAARSGRPQVAGLLPVPRRLAEGIVAASGVPPHRIGPELSRDERQRLVATLKALLLPVTGTLGFEKAEVTSGGVSLEEVDPRTMESRLCRGLYFCGEVLDLDGRIGGYNFQAAWSTGWLAGASAAATRASNS